MVSEFNSVIDWVKDIVDGLFNSFYFSSDNKVKFLALFSVFIPLFSYFVYIIFKFLFGFRPDHLSINTMDNFYRQRHIEDFKNISAGYLLKWKNKDLYEDLDPKTLKTSFKFGGIKTVKNPVSGFVPLSIDSSVDDFGSYDQDGFHPGSDVQDHSSVILPGSGEYSKGHVWNIDPNQGNQKI